LFNRIFDLERLPITRRLVVENPLTGAEGRHLLRTGIGRQLRLSWLLLAVVFGGLVAMIAINFAVPIARLLPSAISVGDVERAFIQIVELSAMAAVGLVLIQTALMTGIAPRLTSTTLAREKQGRTWEALILTGIDARRIVWGKWAAVVLLLLRRHRTTLLLRPILWVWIIAVGRWRGLLPENASIGVLLTVVIALILAPVLSTALFAAYGMVASSWVASETAASRLLGGLQVVVVLSVFALFCVLTPVFSFSTENDMLLALLAGTLLTTLDSGLIGLLFTFTPMDEAARLSYVGGVALWGALTLAMTYGLLRVAVWSAVRAGASPRG